MVDKKIIASFELTLIIISVFAFSYGIAITEDTFNSAIKEIENVRAEKINSIINMQPQKSALSIVFDYIKRPIIPSVSAADVNKNGIDDDKEGITQKGLSTGDKILGRYFIEKTTKSTFAISSQATDAGCCFVAKDGQMCATAAPSECVDESPFAEGALCAQTSFCQKGCCYDKNTGIYDNNVLELDCKRNWVADPNCNMPEAKRGCCVLGDVSFFETQGQCQTRTKTFAQGGGVLDWRSNLNEGQCVMLSANQKQGSCVLGGGECKSGTEAMCYSYGGQFSEGFLCTSPLLNTSCKPTEKTTCVDGRDGVYFLDSCGNVANIYDSKRKNDPTYWDLIIPAADICGDSNVNTANANSESCGNCNRFLGSICASAFENNFKVNSGNFYCKPTSCMFNGVSYKNGESWCVYDGAIGNGNDVVGSRHWKYVCSQGTVQIEPCADYRNQICVQQNTFDINGTEVQFRNSACIANNWRECIDLNSQEDGLERCGDTLNCRIENITIADMFKFDICLPKYPGGFSLKDERYMDTAKKTCGMATTNCTVIYKPKLTGGCELVANGDCLKAVFGEKMNDYCRSLGDCGGQVNILGEYTENHNIKKSKKLSDVYIDSLKKLANPVPGQFAEVEDYTKYLESAGFWGNPEEMKYNPDGEEGDDITPNPAVMGIGVAGLTAAVSICGAAAFMASYSIMSLNLISSSGVLVSAGNTLGGGMAQLSFSQFGAAFAGAAIAGAVGAIAGSMIAKQLGLSPLGSMLMSVGGAMVAVGLAIATDFLGAAALCPPCAPYLIIIGLILIAISLFLGGSSCKPVTVQFECKPWKPPTGDADCDKCNNDPLKPCSEYRCNSLGAACELVNKGSENEMCASKKDDGKPPVLRPREDYMSWTEKYSDITDSGFRITNLNGGCIDAYTPLVFGITTDKLSYCKFDIQPIEFELMEYDLGPNAYVYNHTTTFMLPDPSHGQSQGSNWTGDLTLYIKCQDAFGHINPKFYTVGMCVNEGDDVTPPIIKATQPNNDAIVSFDSKEQNIIIATNELATCKWGLSDVDYSIMENSMNCGDEFGVPSAPQGYTCSATLPVGNANNKYYIRCMDQPWLEDEFERNANTQSFIYTLRKPSNKISIDWIMPDKSFEINTDMVTIELKIQTSGGGEYHKCSYSFSGYERMIQFFETGTQKTHVQLLNRPSGTNKIYIECGDETGDITRTSTEFTIIRDTSVPAIARAWQSGGKLYIITTEEAECKYSTTSCRFNWIDGVDAGVGDEHIINALKGETYYIKCEDKFGNAPSDCSIMLQAL